MRALAVLAIIAFHAGISPYDGGFVTLDVFFVVSGFLITYLLLREIDRTGRLSLVDFYRRRARRILPAATVATVGIVAASWLWLSLVSAEDAARDAVWAALFAANVRFAIEETDYFAAEDPASPFQHYWSLSVEEQFYVVLPILLIAGVLFARRRWGGGGQASPVAVRRVLAVLVGAVTVVSLGWSVHASEASPQTAYFSTFTRVWEFGVGALVAILGARLARRFRPAHRNALAVGGLGMIVVACFTITEADPYPGYLALVPVVGTALVMIAGAELGEAPEPLAQRLLGIAPLRVIGDWSYSLYLWHWPVLIIATQHLGRELSPRGLVAAIAITFLVSYASFRFVETPFRKGMPPRLGRGLALYPIAVAGVLVTSLLVVTASQHQLSGTDGSITAAAYRHTVSGKDLAEDPAVALVQASARAASENAEIPADLDPPLLELADDNADLGGCDYDSQPPWELCRRGDPDAERTIVVVGNSHGRHWIPAFEAIGERAGFAVYYLVKAQCTAARVPVVKQEEVWQECQDFHAWAQEQIEELRPELVVISSSGARAVEIDGEVVRSRDEVVETHRAGFAELVEAVTEPARRTVVLGDVPRRRNVIAECLGRRGATLGDCDDRPRGYAARVAAASEEAARDGGAEYVDTTAWFCSEGTCPPVVGSTIPMRDEHHVSTVYATELAGPLRKKLGLRARRHRSSTATGGG